MQAPSQVGDISVYRPQRYRISPLWRGELTESCINRYKMRVDPLSFSNQRASFSWRAPGQAVILNPNAFIEASFLIRTPGHQDYKTLLSPILQLGNTRDVAAVGAAAAVEHYAASYQPKICFGSGDAFGGSLTNYQLVVNGASLSNARMNTYKQVLDRVWYSEDTFQRRFSQCGGKQDQYDSTAVSGDAFARNAVHGNAANFSKVVAFTQDSGLQKRIENLMSCTVSLPVPGAEADQYDERIIRIRWPVQGCGVFSAVSPQAKDELSVSCPYRRSAMALPHMNSCSIDLLFQDMEECLIRNLSTVTEQNGDAIATADTRGGVTVVLMDSANTYGAQPPQLHLEYLRLGSWRSSPASASLQVFRIAVHESVKTTPYPVMRAIPANVTRTGVGELQNALRCVGTDRETGDEARTAAFEPEYLEVQWSGIVSSQIPSYLAFCLQKSSRVYCLGQGVDDAVNKQVVDFDYTAGAPAAGGSEAGLLNYFRARNTDASAAILDFKMEIQSSIGAYVYSDENFPNVRTRHDLWRDHLKYAVRDYCNSDINTWWKHQCILLLGSDSWARGLGSPGSSFPVVINATVRFCNARQFICGSACSAADTAVGPAVLRDCIQGVPVMLQIYPQSSLQVSPSSALVSSMNISHAQAMDLLARGGGQ